MVNTVWQPSCSLALLQRRSQMLRDIRRFFEERSVLEVETPLLCQTVGTDPNLDFFTTALHWPPTNPRLYLQTSPEFAMKRLLASGCGSIYQISKAFRNGESGRFHNPEFTLLEWYRTGFDLPQLMDEVVALMERLLAHRLKGVERVSYQALFQRYTDLDCLIFNEQDYETCANAYHLHEAKALCGQDHALWLDFLFSHVVQPRMRDGMLYMVYSYPACFSSLARRNQENSLVTERVEVFFNGVELGNGYFELGDAQEQEQRFDMEIEMRQQQNLLKVNKDTRLLAALNAGLPDCAGIALGLDRILMLLADCASIQEAIAFPIDRA